MPAETELREGEKACVIGAGPSGIAACQVLGVRGVPVDCFEKGSDIGGNWRYENDNGLSSAYRSLHIDSSRDLLAYSTFPMPGDYPDYPNHFQLARYFDDYVEHFGLRERITFNTEVLSVEPAPEGKGWDVTVEDDRGGRETRRYGAVVVANGHHWDPRRPEPPFPGADEFLGEQIHAHHYREPDVLEGKRVLVLGIGNSAVDIAVESSRTADATFLAMRRGAHVLPKYLRGRPTDAAATPTLSRAPLPVQRFFLKQMLRVSVGKMTDYGLPEPDHKLLEAHPTVSSELHSRIGHGDISVKPNIERFEGSRVRFADGSEEEIDLVVYCTGYKISFPFLDQSLVSTEDNRVSLFRRVVPPRLPGLYFIGLIQPLGPIMPVAEAQCEWVAELLDGSAALPDPEEMEREAEKEQRKMEKRYVKSKRHTIEVDFYPYLRALRRERKRGARRRPGAARDAGRTEVAAAASGP